ncbi:hypothetical protein HanRHA438_Chr02g0060331 [Helianthus annuus]|nr:hypothetical protein HanRHA438_Chr02g0060331 [Helianthus annuus]
MGFPFPNVIPNLEEPRRYLRIHLTASQCFLPGFDRNRLSTPIAWAISGLIHTIAYIKLPTADAYGTLSMSLISSFEEGQSLSVSLKLGVRGELTDLALSMLNLRSTFSMYCSCDMCNFFEALSLVI